MHPLYDRCQWVQVNRITQKLQRARSRNWGEPGGGNLGTGQEVYFEVRRHVDRQKQRQKQGKSRENRKAGQAKARQKQDRRK